MTWLSVLLLVANAAGARTALWQCDVTLTIDGNARSETRLDVELTADKKALVTYGSSTWETGTLTRQGSALVYGEITPGETDERFVTTTMLRIDTTSGDFVWTDNRDGQRVFRGHCTRAS